MKQGIALKKQAVLQKEASEVLSRLDLINILSNYGEVKMVGSVALGIMTWPDIDIDLESIAGINDMDYFEILKEIFNKKNIKQIILIDNRSPFEKNRSKSMYIGSFIIWKELIGRWILDI